MTFHSNLVVSGMFINKGTSLSAFISVHHLHADIILHHTSGLGTDLALGESLAFPLQLWALSTLQLFSGEQSAVSWLLAAFTPVTR